MVAFQSALFARDNMIRRALAGDAEACFELGMAYSCGSDGVGIDLIEAHKWFNLAAMAGDARGQDLRAEVALDMDARQIAEAQRQARALSVSRVTLQAA